MIDILIGIVAAILTIVGIAPLFFIINSFVDDLEDISFTHKDNDNENGN